MLVLVAPGQGAQAPGFLSPWLELPGVADRLHWWSAVAGIDLIRYGTEADAEEIRDTAVAQPLLVAAGLVSLDALLGGAEGIGGPGTGSLAGPATDGSDSSTADGSGSPVGTGVFGAVAGHSVGELTAAAAAGALSPEAAMVLVRRRGLAMAEAAAITETGMSAVLGGDPDMVAAHLSKLSLTPANMNGGGQIVAAGTLPQLAALAEDAPEGARVRPLQVAGAFHTQHMAPAVSTLEALVAGITVNDPAIRYVSNKDGQPVSSGQELIRRLVAQVSNPVRWDLCMETFKELGITALIEVCPGGTLTGLARRALPGVKTVALRKPDDLKKARTLIAEYSSAGTPAA